MSTLCRRRDRSSSLGPLVCLAACATTACLPRGEPPTGRQVIADRTSYLTGIVAPTSDGVLRLLVARISPDNASNDLYVVSVPDVGPPSERLLVPDLPTGVPCEIRASGFLSEPCYPTDARGRLYLYTGYDAYDGTSTIARIDPVTGEREDLGHGRYFAMSPSRDRVLVVAIDDGTLYESDGQATVLPLNQGAAYGIFLGEDLFYTTPDQALLRLRPHGTPEPVRTGVTSFLRQETDAGPVLLVYAVGGDPPVGTDSVLDPVTLEDLFAPILTSVSVSISVSPDRRWLLEEESNNTGRLTFIDGMTGEREEVAPLDSGTRNGKEWRPGHAEVWYQVFGSQTDGLPAARTWIKSPGKPAITVPLYAEGLYDLSHGRGSQSFFTGDGAFWFSEHPSREEPRPGIQIGPADDPNGGYLDLNPRGTYNAGYYPLADGRLLVSAYYTDFRRSNISAVDPATGASQLLGEQGSVLAVGQRRVLANLHIIDSYGDLTAIDLPDGHATLLASEFAYAAFIQPQGPDAAEQGAPVAFQFRARFDSPYDGIWVTALP